MWTTIFSSATFGVIKHRFIGTLVAYVWMVIRYIDVGLLGTVSGVHFQKYLFKKGNGGTFFDGSMV